MVSPPPPPLTEVKHTWHSMLGPLLDQTISLIFKVIHSDIIELLSFPWFVCGCCGREVIFIMKCLLLLNWCCCSILFQLSEKKNGFYPLWWWKWVADEIDSNWLKWFGQLLFLAVLFNFILLLTCQHVFFTVCIQIRVFTGSIPRRSECISLFLSFTHFQYY